MDNRLSIFERMKKHMMYSDKVWDHFTNPRNVGEIADADGIGEVGNATCGDIMKIYLKINGDIITDVKFKTFGCGAAIATSSMATEMIKGKPLSEALQLTNKAVVEALDGLPPVKVHCSVLAEQAIKHAIADYYRRNGLPCPLSGYWQRSAAGSIPRSLSICCVNRDMRSKGSFWNFLLRIGRRSSPHRSSQNR